MSSGTHNFSEREGMPHLNSDGCFAATALNECKIEARDDNELRKPDASRSCDSQLIRASLPPRSPKDEFKIAMASTCRALLRKMHGRNTNSPINLDSQDLRSPLAIYLDSVRAGNRVMYEMDTNHQSHNHQLYRSKILSFGGKSFPSYPTAPAYSPANMGSRDLLSYDALHSRSVRSGKRPMYEMENSGPVPQRHKYQLDRSELLRFGGKTFPSYPTPPTNIVSIQPLGFSSASDFKFSNPNPWSSYMGIKSKMMFPEGFTHVMGQPGLLDDGPISFPTRTLCLYSTPSANAKAHDIETLYNVATLWFCSALADYLIRAIAPEQAEHLDKISIVKQLERFYFPIWNFIRSLEHRRDGSILEEDKIWAIRKQNPSLPSTAELIHLGSESCGKTGIQTLRVAQVRVIFGSPTVIGHSGERTVPSYLALVEWFSPFEIQPEESHEGNSVLQISRMKRPDGQNESGIVPVTSIRRRVNLYSPPSHSTPGDMVPSSAENYLVHIMDSDITKITSLPLMFI